MKKRLLVVEDDVALAEGLKLNAELEGYEALVASSAEEAEDFSVKKAKLLIDEQGEKLFG